MQQLETFLGDPGNYTSLLIGGLVAVGLSYVYLSWALFVTARKTRQPNPGLAWIPIANLLLMCRIGQRPGWWVFLLLIPVINILPFLLLFMALAEVRGKPWWTGLLMVAPPVCLFVPAYIALGGESVPSPPAAAAAGSDGVSIPVPPTSPVAQDHGIDGIGQAVLDTHSDRLATDPAPAAPVAPSPPQMAAGSRRCRRCGVQHFESTRFCRKCEQELSQKVQTPQPATSRPVPPRPDTPRPVPPRLAPRPDTPRPVPPRPATGEPQLPDPSTVVAADPRRPPGEQRPVAPSSERASARPLPEPALGAARMAAEAIKKPATERGPGPSVWAVEEPFSEPPVAAHQPQPTTPAARPPRGSSAALPPQNVDPPSASPWEEQRPAVSMPPTSTQPAKQPVSEPPATAHQARPPSASPWEEQRPAVAMPAPPGKAAEQEKSEAPVGADQARTSEPASPKTANMPSTSPWGEQRPAVSPPSAPTIPAAHLRGTGKAAEPAPRFERTMAIGTQPANQRWVIIRIDRAGKELSHHVIEPPVTLVGRDDGDIKFPDDGFLSNPHARFHFEGGKLHIKDLGSTNGVFIRVREPRALTIGDVFIVGRQILRLDPPGNAGPDGQRAPTLAVVASSGEAGRRHVLTGPEKVIGRASGDIVFANDEYVSGRHAVIRMTGGTPVLEDLGSQNGTYIKVKGPVELQLGDYLNLGQQLFLVARE